MTIKLLQAYWPSSHVSSGCLKLQRSSSSPDANINLKNSANVCVVFQTIAGIYKNPGHGLARKKKASYNDYPIGSIKEGGRIEF
jgi:hypothetical protein